MNDRMTVVDIARHLKVSRPSAYKIIRSAGFPEPGADKRWDRTDVMAWLDAKTVGNATVVGGVLITA
jgi:predicted DNA-binding transcriptional regulator AlpA